LTKKDTLELFKFLKSVFPQFEVDQYKIDTWTSLLKDQNPAVVMRNAERYALENKFPPSVADIRERKMYQSNILDQIKEWESNAARK
jgi:Loader and inhibitor of phage G40P